MHLPFWRRLLVHPCPAHPAVEQAGGDERAAFERAFTVQEGIYFDDKRSEYRSMNLRAIEATDAQDLNLRLQGWQARAALAQPSPLQAEQPTADDYEEVLADHRRLVRELDVLLNGEDGAARQASLCDLVAQVRAVRQTHDENVPADNLGQSLLMLEFALMFALCNFQHADSRNDVKKAQTRLQEVLRFLSGKAKGFHLNTTELGYCAENPDVLRAWPMNTTPALQRPRLSICRAPSTPTKPVPPCSAPRPSGSRMNCDGNLRSGEWR